MELTTLTSGAKTILEVSEPCEIGGALMERVLANDTGMYEKFIELTGDMTTDYMQPIYQYYLADRVDRKQDFTPQSLAVFMSLLCGEADTVVDMCAGTGALTIQRWNRDKQASFELAEIDEKVLPFLLFNMAIRNISCTVKHGDVLQGKTFKTYIVRKGERYGQVSCVEPAV